MNNPYLSIVLGARNDDYGGNLICRINAFLHTTTKLIEEYEIDAEIVLVEYNPPIDKKRLYEVLTLPKNHKVPIRFIEVPSQFHESIAGASKNPMFEYIAKNLGIKRARGEFILATNQDVIISRELIAEIAKRGLDKNSYYRANRHDLGIYDIDINQPLEKILGTCKNNIDKILLPEITLYISYLEWFKRFIHGRTFRNLLLCPIFNNVSAARKIIIKKRVGILHENAAGDFTLTHKDSWNIVGGYDESPVGSALLDGYLLYFLYCFGYEEKIFDGPIYHINHLDSKGKRPLMSYKKYTEDINTMIETKKTIRPINNKWGFADWQFEEKVY